MARHQGTKEFWLAALRVETADLISTATEAIESGNAGTPVPSCPGWTMLDLAHHAGSVCRWISDHAARGTTSAPDYFVRDLTDFPPLDETLPWLGEQVSRLITTLDGLDPALPAWNWAPQAKVAGFWHRRAAHEFSVHRWDAQMALARAEPIEARLAADGVSEVLDSWLPAGRGRKGPTDRFGVIRLLATDVDQEWFLRLRGSGVALIDTDTILDAAEPHTRVEVAGLASDLNLAIWGRVGFDVAEISGDESLLESLRVG
ncbi:uncharacterized protein (TIGR03083 family) [Allocatelliglobosispora scoriae]|uniref:Uncharacterized protein (TIGR03083 family) n=1 Tax=Allocatelliglobosispora scoriae TaxID=643052 RepID=A0A841BXK2_9ACTN|nr:maleylpyruvate isomerase family mycothiol-dependent enzyme [Allocatelliglobosispora scoriae]MBB5871411.1 uncharacterized protein (TIGR03083 family) [Allocatelliglobosispora scoriae]